MVIRFQFRETCWQLAVVVLLGSPTGLIAAPDTGPALDPALDPALGAPAETDSDSSEYEKTVAPRDESASETPVYRPPRRGAPKTRVGGGTRDLSGGDMPTISLLAPMATGLTSRASPTLFWHLSKAYEGIFEFVLVEQGGNPEPIYRERAERRFGSGYHTFDLAQAEVELVAGRVYQWSVALVRDPERRSQDVLGLATVERTEPSGAVGPAPSVQLMAGAGLWYDAIEAIAPPPHSETVRGYLAALLSQVGLAAVTAGS